MARTGRVFNRVTVDDLAETGTRVATIATAKVVSFDNDYLSDNARKVVLTFTELGDKEFVVNATSFHLLVDRYSNDKANGFASWIGKQVVLTKVETDNPQTGEKVAAVWVARPKEWDTAIREHVSASRGGRSRRRS